MNLRRRLISVDENTYQSLKKLGQAGDSFNDVLRIILRVKGMNKDGKSSTS
jgi:predicted CopG family antitoxin